MSDKASIDKLEQEIKDILGNSKYIIMTHKKKHRFLQPLQRIEGRIHKQDDKVLRNFEKSSK